MVLAAIWHYWIAVAVIFGAILFLVATIIGYLVKVVRPKYPPRGYRGQA